MNISFHDFHLYLETAMNRKDEEDEDSSFRKEDKNLEKMRCDLISVSKSVLQKLDNQKTSSKYRGIFQNISCWFNLFYEFADNYKRML